MANCTIDEYFEAIWQAKQLAVKLPGEAF